MMTPRLLTIFLALACSAAVPYTPTDRYERLKIEGWSVLVSPEFDSIRDKRERTLDLLRSKLIEIKHLVPDEACRMLIDVPIWLEVTDPQSKGGACYHPSAGWLKANGYNPDKARSVQITNPDTFWAWTKDQPAMVLHELAHAYHHRILGHDHKEILAAFRSAVESKKYDSVLQMRGKTARHYALNNEKEYFAECTEAFFSTNDFYPFVRAELKQHDPRMYELLKKVWGMK